MGQKDMAVEFIRTLAARKSVRILALYYLTRHLKDYVQLQQLARWINCHPASVSQALDPLTKDKMWAPHLEKQKIGTAVVYRLCNGPPTKLLKKFFDLAIQEYGKTDRTGGK